MTTSFQFLEALRSQNLSEFFLTVRKYPLLPSLILAPLYVLLIGTLIVTGRIDTVDDIRTYLFTGPVETYFMSRFFVLLCALGTLLLLYRISRLIWHDVPAFIAPMLLLTSILFLVFSTAIRPHVLVAAATLLTFERSLMVLRERSVRNELFAFAAATLSFSILQNGIFAFIFPVYAILMDNGHLQFVRFKQLRLWAYLLGSGIASSIIGYSFLWNLPLGRGMDLKFDLGHNFIQDAPKWTGQGFYVELMTGFGSEFILVLFAFLAIALLVRRRIPMNKSVVVLLLFLVSYLLVFGMYAGTSQRFFIIILPFLALLGAAAVAKFRIFGAVVLFSISIVHAQLFILALRPDTYDLAKSFVLEQTSGPVMMDVPQYFLPIHPTRDSIGIPRMELERYLLSLDSDMPEAREFAKSEKEAAVIVRKSINDRPNMAFDLCFVVSSLPEGGNSFLWQEEEWALFWIMRTPRLGPPINVYCRVSAV